MNKKLIKIFRNKYKYLDNGEIMKLNKTKLNSCFEEWYECLQAYVINIFGDRKLVTGSGEDCWKQAYENGDNIAETFEDGFKD
jgi:hypothetical protein